MSLVVAAGNVVTVSGEGSQHGFATAPRAGGSETLRKLGRPCQASTFESWLRHAKRCEHKDTRALVVMKADE